MFSSVSRREYNTNALHRYVIRRGLTTENIILLFYKSEYSFLELVNYVFNINHVIEVTKQLNKITMMYNVATKCMVFL